MLPRWVLAPLYVAAMLLFSASHFKLLIIFFEAKRLANAPLNFRNIAGFASFVGFLLGVGELDE
ncbi:uncharacterized protein V1513DRAFT_452511 [Lipomyces chichibuensis]|uniref:uncharacterized protein n=1 Tax=Lipomyces chichibuensis TaxID=1546026 RepID=UPI0033442E4F